MRCCRYWFVGLLCGVAFMVMSLPVKAAPKFYKTKFENSKVRTFDFAVQPGATVPMDSHPDHLMYFTTQAKLDFTGSDGKVSHQKAKSGDVMWMESTSHSIKNVGRNTVHAFMVEFKDSYSRHKKK